MKRYALIKNQDDAAISRYLPDNYYIMAVVEEGTVVAGEDVAGWTLDAYVLPRLAFGLYWGEEIDLSHPVMKKVPLKWGPNVESNVVFDPDVYKAEFESEQAEKRQLGRKRHTQFD